MKMLLSEIKDTSPTRDHGNMASLVDSINQHGLLHPLVIDQNNVLICGRRRYDALTKLGIKEVEVNVIDCEDKLDLLIKSLAENKIRLNLDSNEYYLAKEEIDQLMRQKHGSQLSGKTITKPRGRPRKKSSSDSDEEVKVREEATKQDETPTKTTDSGWATRKTAELLGESEGKTREDLAIAKAIKTNPKVAEAPTRQGKLDAMGEAKPKRGRPPKAPAEPTVHANDDFRVYKMAVYDWRVFSDKHGHLPKIKELIVVGNKVIAKLEKEYEL